MPPELAAARVAGQRSSLPRRSRPFALRSKTAYIPVGEIAARFGIARSTLYRTISKPAA